MSALPKRYPGRDRVFHRTSAVDVAWHRSLSDLSPRAKLTCSRPVVIHAIGLPGMFDRVQTKVPTEIEARCRKCPECLAHRRRLWTARAIDELKASKRTWFGTLTLSPEQHWVMFCKASVRVSKRRREDIGVLSEPEQFAERVNAIGREVTLWLKRVRKESGAKFRYLLVYERHQSGLPHIHLLLHEVEGAVPKAILDRQWKLGFTKFRLVDDERSAFYVCKYLSKSAEARVRASARYGHADHLVRIYAEAARSAAEAAKACLDAGAPQPVLGVP